MQEKQIGDCTNTCYFRCYFIGTGFSIAFNGHKPIEIASVMNKLWLELKKFCLNWLLERLRICTMWTL
ncbi:hypothetical protein ACQ4LE_004626 [Meloidogyne hapla]